MVCSRVMCHIRELCQIRGCVSCLKQQVLGTRQLVPVYAYVTCSENYEVSSDTCWFETYNPKRAVRRAREVEHANPPEFSKPPWDQATANRDGKPLVTPWKANPERAVRRAVPPKHAQGPKQCTASTCHSPPTHHSAPSFCRHVESWNSTQDASLGNEASSWERYTCTCIYVT